MVAGVAVFGRSRFMPLRRGCGGEMELGRENSTSGVAVEGVVLWKAGLR